jgi:hypothetical protein
MTSTSLTTYSVDSGAATRVTSSPTSISIVSSPPSNMPWTTPMVAPSSESATRVKVGSEAGNSSPTETVCETPLTSRSAVSSCSSSPLPPGAGVVGAGVDGLGAAPESG